MAIAAGLRDLVSAHEFDLKELSYQIFLLDDTRAAKRVELIEELDSIAETEARLLATQGETLGVYCPDGEVLGYYETLELVARSKVEVLMQLNALDSAQDKTNLRRKAAAQALAESEY